MNKILNMYFTDNRTIFITKMMTVKAINLEIFVTENRAISSISLLTTRQ